MPTLDPLLAPFTVLDLAALAALVLCWLTATHLTENPPKRRPSTTVLMARHRREWMLRFVARDNRIFDSQIIGQLRQGTAFFGSASMIAIGGGFALLGNTDRLNGVAEDLTYIGETPEYVWEIKLVVMLLFACNALLKFIWSNRLFGYCAVLMGAAPNDTKAEEGPRYARKAAEINIIAARAYNRGLRSVYFGIAAAAWLAGAAPLIGASLFTLGMILRREFWSRSRDVLLED